MDRFAIPDRVTACIASHLTAIKDLKKLRLLSRSFQRAADSALWGSLQLNIDATLTPNSASTASDVVNFTLPSTILPEKWPLITRLHLSLRSNLRQDTRYTFDRVLEECISLEHLELDLPLSHLTNNADVAIPSIALRGFDQFDGWTTAITAESFMYLVDHCRPLKLSLFNVMSGFDQILKTIRVKPSSLDIKSLHLHRCFFTQTGGLVRLLAAIKELSRLRLTFELNYNGCLPSDIFHTANRGLQLALQRHQESLRELCIDCTLQGNALTYSNSLELGGYQSGLSFQNLTHLTTLSLPVIPYLCNSALGHDIRNILPPSLRVLHLQLHVHTLYDHSQLIRNHWATISRSLARLLDVKTANCTSLERLMWFHTGKSLKDMGKKEQRSKERYLTDLKEFAVLFEELGIEFYYEEVPSFDDSPLGLSYKKFSYRAIERPCSVVEVEDESKDEGPKRWGSIGIVDLEKVRVPLELEEEDDQQELARKRRKL